MGSLLRPERLKQAREKFLGPQTATNAIGPHDNAHLRQVEDECIREVVGMQERVGLRAVTDGEFRRRSWWLELILGVFILFVTWMPKLGRFGAERGRFAVLGFMTTFVGVFVSATGTLLAPFIAASTPDRRIHVATMGALMTITHISKIAAFGFIGFAIGSYVPLMAAMIAAGAVGNWVGEVALLKTSEKSFRVVLQVALTLLGLQLLWRAAQGAGLI